MQVVLITQLIGWSEEGLETLQMVLPISGIESFSNQFQSSSWYCFEVLSAYRGFGNLINYLIIFIVKGRLDPPLAFDLAEG